MMIKELERLSLCFMENVSVSNGFRLLFSTRLGGLGSKIEELQ